MVSQNESVPVSFLDRSRFSPPLLTINAWNEWTKGSYLPPDTRSGTAYLEAIAHIGMLTIHLQES